MENPVPPNVSAETRQASAVQPTPLQRACEIAASIIGIPINKPAPLAPETIEAAAWASNGPALIESAARGTFWESMPQKVRTAAGILQQLKTEIQDNQVLRQKVAEDRDRFETHDAPVRECLPWNRAAKVKLTVLVPVVLLGMFGAFFSAYGLLTEAGVERQTTKIGYAMLLLVAPVVPALAITEIRRHAGRNGFYFALTAATSLFVTLWVVAFAINNGQVLTPIESGGLAADIGTMLIKDDPLSVLETKASDNWAWAATAQLLFQLLAELGVAASIKVFLTRQSHTFSKLAAGIGSNPPANPEFAVRAQRANHIGCETVDAAALTDQLESFVTSVQDVEQAYVAESLIALEKVLAEHRPHPNSRKALSSPTSIARVASDKPQPQSDNYFQLNGHLNGIEQ